MSNPYTLTFNNTAGAASANCTGCVIQIGGDFCKASGGVEGTNTNGVMLNNVIDGSDTAESQINPYGDCGNTEGDNQFCVASLTAGWRQPNIWRGNVIRYVQSAFVGECSEWSTNLIEYLRLGTDPTGHTNGIECLDESPINSATLSYGNTIRHANNPNASVPGGQWSVGLLNQYTPVAGSVEYIFDNVIYDTLQNVPLGLFSGGSGCCGSITIFNNTVNGGPSWTSQNYDITNSCPSAYAACTLENNQLVSNISSSVLSNCGSKCTDTTNALQAVSVASGLGFTSNETYAYAPTASPGALGSGTGAQSICTTITDINSAAGGACQSDTPYGVGYNTSNHTVIVPGRTPIARPTGSQAWYIGAYQGSGSGGSSPTPPTG